MTTKKSEKTFKIDLRIDQRGHENSAFSDLSIYHFVYFLPFYDLDWKICVVRKQLPGKTFF